MFYATHRLHIFWFPKLSWSPLLAKKANGRARDWTRKKYRKGKTRAHHEWMSSLPIGCMNFLFPKTVDHHFWPGLMARSMICERRFDLWEHYCRPFFVDPSIAKTCKERGMRKERGFVDPSIAKTCKERGMWKERGGTKEERRKEGRGTRKNKTKKGEKEGGFVNIELILFIFGGFR